MGRYQLERRIATGGMGEVFEAHSLSEGVFRRRVAVKRLLPEVVEHPEFVSMFLDEARIASHLHHANIVGILDFGVAEGRPFQVLEFVDGLTARELGRRTAGSLPVDVALQVCTEVAHALHYAHEAKDAEGAPLGIVHRDVNPNNILVSWEGDVKLSDFGIAFARDRQGRTAVGTVKGTPAFMAPEQHVSGPLDRRTDVFALGCVLHALLAGASPLSAEGSLSDLLADRPLRLSAHLPEDVRAVIERAVRPRRADRFATAADMARELGLLLRQRLEGDARTRLRGWLSQQRASDSPRRPLKDLVASALDPGPSIQVEGMVAEANRPAPPVRRRWVGWVAAGATAAAAAGIAASWQEARPKSAAPALAPAAPLKPLVISLPVRPPPDPREPQANHVPVKPRPKAAAELGAVVIGGEGAYRAEILVDGQSRGFAPRTLELPVGRHACELVTPQGQRLGPHTLEVTSRHTARDPLRWIVPPQF